MSTLLEKRQYIIESLQSSKDYREQYVDANIRNGLACQIRAMREKRGWTQGELGMKIKGVVQQETISKYEDPNYGKYTLETLRRLAAAFDVDLVVRFGPFSERINYMTHLNPSNFEVPSFEDEHLTEDTDDEWVDATTDDGSIIERSTTTAGMGTIIAQSTRASGADVPSLPLALPEPVNIALYRLTRSRTRSCNYEYELAATVQGRK